MASWRSGCADSWVVSGADPPLCGGGGACTCGWRVPAPHRRQWTPASHPRMPWLAPHVHLHGRLWSVCGVAHCSAGPRIASRQQAHSAPGAPLNAIHPPLPVPTLSCRKR